MICELVLFFFLTFFFCCLSDCQEFLDETAPPHLIFKNDTSFVPARVSDPLLQRATVRIRNPGSEDAETLIGMKPVDI